jgi:hypothetical protein
MNIENKIVVSATLAGRLLKVLKEEKETLEEKLLDLEMEIEEIENNLKTPIVPLDKKNGTDFALSITRVEQLVSKQSGLDLDGYKEILAVDLNLDKSSKDTMKLLRQRTYSHLYNLKNKNKITAEYVQETASTVYFPKPVDGNPPLKPHSTLTINGADPRRSSL